MDPYLNQHLDRQDRARREHDSAAAHRAYIRNLATLMDQGVSLPPALEELARQGRYMEGVRS